MTTEHFILLAAMGGLIVAPTLIVHLSHRRAEKRRAGQRGELEEPVRAAHRRRRGRFCDAEHDRS